MAGISGTVPGRTVPVVDAPVLGVACWKKCDSMVCRDPFAEEWDVAICASCNHRARCRGVPCSRSSRGFWK